MKDDLHKDKLEEFLRKSLEGHSEEPPGDLWSNIAANLDAPVASPPSAAPKLRVLRSWWSVAAAAAVVTGLLIGQHLYFSGKIEHLNKALEQNTAQLKELEQKRISEEQTLPIEEAIESETAPQNVATNEPELPNNGLQNDAQPDLPAKQARPTSHPTSQVAKEKKQVNGADGTLPPTSIANANDEVKNAGNPAGNSTQTDETKQVQDVPATAPAEGDAVAKQADMPRTWGRKLTPLDMPEPAAPTIASIVPASLQQGSRYSVGLQLMPMLTKVKVNNVKQSEPEPGHPFPHGDDKAFTAKNEKSIRSWMTGVALETNLSPRLRIGTGLNYRALDIETTHEFCFEYGEGKPVHGQAEREYEYELNTATGSVQMLVSAASAVSSASIKDTTKVEATIKTSEHLDFASVPLYASYTFGNGRLRVLAKAGIIFNFLMDNKFNLDRIERPEDSKFQFDRPKSRHGAPNDLQTLTASYMAGLGLEYQLSKSLSLRAEPTVMGSLTSLHNNPHIESSEISAGLNLGLMYNF